jgi:hypothetical protein
MDMTHGLSNGLSLFDLTGDHRMEKFGSRRGWINLGRLTKVAGRDWIGLGMDWIKAH